MTGGPGPDAALQSPTGRWPTAWPARWRPWVALSDPALLLTPRAALLQAERYRRHFLANDRQQFVLAAVVIAAGNLVGVRNDFRLLSGWLLSLVLVARSAALVANGISLGLLRRVHLPRQLDRIVAGFFPLATGSYMFSLLSRLPSGEYLGPLGSVTAALCLFYFALHGPLWPRLLYAAGCTVSTLVLFWNPQAPISPAARLTWTVALLIVNLIGLVTTRTVEQQRRRRFQAERQARQAQQQLAAKLRELGREKDRAESLSRARTRFLAAMSHEFRTPMNAVIGLSDVLLAAPPTATLSGDYRTYVQTISDSARALLGQLNDILDFAKIDAQKLHLMPAPFDLRRLADSVVAMLRPLAESRQLLLTLELSPLIPAALVGDEARLRQVLVNLLSNGLKFTERGAVQLQVTARLAGPSEYALSFRCADSGIGLSPEAMGRLFQPFSQADVGIARRFGGTGLGLSISQQIVRAMGGELAVESAPSRGSVFSFQLRLQAVAQPLPTPSLPLSAGAPVGTLPLAILVVDDNPLNLLVAQAGLGQLGYPADQANSGVEAVAAVAQRDYDVIFMDLHMPQMSGLEATAAIGTQLGSRRPPHIVAMTASVFEEDRLACRQAGMRDFVDKPVDFRQVGELLSRLASERG